MTTGIPASTYTSRNVPTRAAVARSVGRSDSSAIPSPAVVERRRDAPATSRPASSDIDCCARSAMFVTGRSRSAQNVRDRVDVSTNSGPRTRRSRRRPSRSIRRVRRGLGHEGPRCQRAGSHSATTAPASGGRWWTRANYRAVSGAATRAPLAGIRRDRAPQRYADGEAKDGKARRRVVPNEQRHRPPRAAGSPTAQTGPIGGAKRARTSPRDQVHADQVDARPSHADQSTTTTSTPTKAPTPRRPPPRPATANRTPATKAPRPRAAVTRSRCWNGEKERADEDSAAPRRPVRKAEWQQANRFQGDRFPRRPVQGDRFQGGRRHRSNDRQPRG